MRKGLSATRGLRARAKITSHFRIPSSDHLWPCLNRNILEIVHLFLWFCSIGTTPSDPNPGANSVNLFLREPLEADLFGYDIPLNLGGSLTDSVYQGVSEVPEYGIFAHDTVPAVDLYGLPGNLDGHFRNEKLA
jgi:hypothetical protein